MTKNILNNPKVISRKDRPAVLESIRSFNEQVKEVFTQIKTMTLPASYREIDNIVVCGMGGSTLGADAIISFFTQELKIPVIINNQYNLPGFSNAKTLIILSSYSGNTEETINCLKEALRKRLKIIVFATGGQLATKAKKHKLPVLIIDPKDNPSKQPRLGLGYNLAFFWKIFEKLGVLKSDLNKETLFFAALKKAQAKYDFNKDNNQAKKIALQLKGKLPIFVASEFLAGSAHALTNLLNENAKVFADYFLLPEFNHHLIEGLTYPSNLKKNYQFVLLNSSFYHPQNQKRYKIIQTILKKQKISYVEFKPSGGNPISQIAETLIFGLYLSFYLAILYDVNPTAIPWVNYLKNQLTNK